MAEQRRRPDPRLVLAPDGVPVASYDYGNPEGTTDAPVVLAVHGFASSAAANWQLTGWVRDLDRAGFRLITLDLRGHGASGTPHDPAAYTMERLGDDVLAVIDAYMLGDVSLLGYSLGSRLGWRLALEHPHLIARAVLGGLPDGDPLTSFDLDQARQHLRDGSPINDSLTATFMAMAATLPGNDLEALVALVEGMRGGPQASRDQAPGQQLLLATGTNDRILEGSRGLAAAAPHAEFLELPGRTHFNAPTSGLFRDAAVRFFAQHTAS